MNVATNTVAYNSILLRLPAERDVYRCLNVVPGMVTYFAVTNMGMLLNDEMLTVKPGPVTEARAVAALRKALHEHDGGKVRPPLKLHRSRHVVSSDASPSPALLLIREP